MTATAGGRGGVRRWTIGALLLALLAGAVALVGRADPRLDVKQLDRLLDPGAGALLRWQGEPRLTLFPTPTVTLTGVTVRHERDRVPILHAAVPRMEIALEVLPLLTGRIRAEAIRLLEADIRLTGNPAASEPAWLELLRTAMALPAALELYDATIHFPASARRNDRLHDVELHLDWDAAEQRLAVSGNATVRAQPMRFDVVLLDPERLRDPAGARASVRVDGFADAALRAEGRFHLARVDGPASHPQLRIREGDFRFGGSAGRGELALSYVDDRPRVSGRLELSELALAPYLERWLPNDLTELLAMPVSGRWLRGAEVDLETRAAAVDLGLVRLANTDARVRLHDARLVLTVAGAEVAGGTIDGELAVAAAGDGIAARGAGRLEDVSLTEAGDRFARPRVDVLIGGEDPPQGRGSSRFNVAARGATVRALVSSLAGRVETVIRDGSLPGADAVATLERVLDGHAGIAEGNAPFIPIAGRTRFSQLSARLLAGDGTLWLEGVRVQGDEFEIALTGELDLNDGEVLAQGTARLFDADAASGSSVLVELPFGVGGTLLEPMGAPGIPRLEPGAERTARTVGPPALHPPIARRDPRVG